MPSFLELRKATGKSRAQVAADLKISERRLFDIEKGRATPRRLTAIALAAYYGVAVEAITQEAPA